MRGFIDKGGRLIVREIHGPGHPDAVKLIKNTLSTWIYVPYKTGTILFYFNAPSKGRKLIIDKMGLEKNLDIVGDKDVFDGRIYYISGLPAHDIAYGNVRF